MSIHTGSIRSVSAAVRATPLPLKHAEVAAAPVEAKFITISREGGAGGRTLGQALVNRLNALDPKPAPWVLWDRQLVEKVAADHNLSHDIVDSLGESGRTWVEDFLGNLTQGVDQSEARVYQAVATTIRALAQKGRVVIIGRGGVYITRNLKGGVHLRLIAPLEYRVRFMATQLGVDLDQAAAHVHQLDKQRAAFYRRWWPREIMTPEAFTVTLNVARTDENRVVESVIPLVLNDVQVARSANIRKPGTAVP